MRQLVSTLCVLGTAILFLTACSKSDIPNPVADSYLIDTLNADGEHFVFSYNKKGDPLSIIRDHSYSGSPNYFFRYDAKGRLSAYFSTYTSTGTGFFEQWHVYTYNAKDQIITDSTYEFGILDADQKPIPGQSHPTVPAIVTTYAYDQYGRIITNEAKWWTNPNSIWYKDTYHYNPQGNLYKIVEQRDGYAETTSTFTFDNKVNPHRTSWLWQFLDKDYSLNQQLPVTAYNKQGLPVTLEASHDTRAFLNAIYQHLDITYKRK